MRALIRWLVPLALGFAGAAHAASCEKPAADSSRIAVAGGSLTEIVYLLGAGDRIVAADTTSNYPAAARELPSVGYVRELSAEGLLSLEPTLVLGEHDMGPDAVLDQLRQTSVDVLAVPEAHTTDGIVQKIRCVATALGLPEQGEEIIGAALADTLSTLDRIRSQSGEDRPSVAVLLTFSDGSPLIAGRETAGAGVLDMAGADNAFDFEGWKPVSMEAMVRTNPDYILITDRGVRAAGGMDDVLANPAIRLTSAGKTQNVIAFDGMSLLGFGPRTLTTAVEVAARLNPNVRGLAAADE